MLNNFNLTINYDMTVINYLKGKEKYLEIIVI